MARGANVLAPLWSARIGSVSACIPHPDAQDPFEAAGVKPTQGAGSPTPDRPRTPKASK